MSVVRFSGIYGPGRDYLIRQVLSGKGGNDQYTNRIHIDDCVGVITFLLGEKQILPLYLASDSTPVKSAEIRSWLAGQLGVDSKTLIPSGVSGRGGSKRCANARLLNLGYQFKFPDYTLGYAMQISARR